MQIIFVCQNDRGPDHPTRSCKQKGSDKILAYLKEQIKMRGIPNVRATASGCLGECRNGPMCVLYPNDEWKRIATIEEADYWLLQMENTRCL